MRQIRLMKGVELTNLLCKKASFSRIGRDNGSHAILVFGNSKTLAIPLHKKSLKPGIFYSLLKEAAQRMNVEEWELREKLEL